MKEDRLPVSPNVFKKYIKKVFIDIYGEDRTEINFEEETNIVATVHFPYITIKNEVGQEYDIYDTYVRFVFHTKTRGILIYLLRTTFQTTDFINSQLYIHSHVPPTSYIRFNRMCLGDTLFGTKTSLFHCEKAGDLMQLPVILHAFNNLINVESLDGVPYYRIEYLVDSPFCKRRDLNVSNVDIETIANKVLSKMNQFSYRFDEENNVILENVADVLNNIKLHNKYKVKLINGIRFSIQKKKRFQTKGKESVEGICFVFKGSVIPYTVIESKSYEDIIKTKSTVDPQLVKKVNNYLSSEFIDFLTLNYK